MAVVGWFGIVFQRANLILSVQSATTTTIMIDTENGVFIIFCLLYLSPFCNFSCQHIILMRCQVT